MSLIKQFKTQRQTEIEIKNTFYLHSYSDYVMKYVKCQNHMDEKENPVLQVLKTRSSELVSCFLSLVCR